MKPEVLKYTLLESGIHHFIMLQGNDEVAQQYLHEFNRILQGARPKPDEPPVNLKFLLDFRQTTMPPLSDMVAETVEQRRRDLILNFRVTCYFAYLAGDEDITEKVQNLTPLARAVDHRKIFKADQEQDAIDWLLSL